MNDIELGKALRTGKRVYGTLIVSASSLFPKAVRATGIDFVFIDTEHIPIDSVVLSWMCQTYRAIGLPPLVRIHSPNPVEARMVLDWGAVGVIAPYVETDDQVRELVGATKLRPLKGKRKDVALRNPKELSQGLKKYLEEFNSSNVLIVNIESVPALENLNEILSVPGLDAVLIGPHDLSVSLGIPEQYRDPVFNSAVQDIIESARQRNVGAGFHFGGHLDLEIEWIKAGVNLIIHGGDFTLFCEKLREDIIHIRQSVRETEMSFLQDRPPIV